MLTLLSERHDTGAVRNSAATIDLVCDSVLKRVELKSHRWLTFEEIQALHAIDVKIDDRLERRRGVEVSQIGETDNRTDLARFVSAVCKKQVNKYAVDRYYRRLR